MRRFLLLPLLVLTARAADDIETVIKQFIDAYAAVEQNAADPATADQLIFQGAVPGLLRRLDPHSVFFDPDQFDQLRKMENSTQKGFGSVVSVLPGRVIVLQTLPGTPSAKSGLSPGDEIVAINGYIIARLEMEQLVALLSQSKQQPARLDVRRPGNALIMHFVLTPEDMQSPSVERAFMLQPGTGYLRVASFDENTGKLIHESIEKLGGTKLTGLVLDLRNNPGGLVASALQTLSLFLPPGTKLVTVRGRSVEEKIEVVPKTATPYTFPMAVLLNGKSASASEIVSGALQDHDRATIIGEPSFGKGLVQSVYPLSQNAGLALTTALYYTPSGRSIQKAFDPKQFALGGTSAHPNKEKEFRTDKGRVVTGGGGIQPDYVVLPEGMTRLRAALEASGSFTNFATGYVQKNKITDSFDVTPHLLDEFQLFLAQRQIQPSIGEWSSERAFVQNRLKTEIFNQALGVEKGDQVEAQRDPLILKALDVISTANAHK
jgi:carboxyl-terminal processing protease